jgi:hypothetical protein
MMTVDNIVLLVLFALIVVLGAALLLRRRAPQSMVEHPPSEGEFLTSAERVFLARLENALGADFRIFSKTPLGHLLRHALQKNRRQTFGRSDQLLDFVLCRKDDSRVIGVIQLGETPDRQVVGALAAAGIASVYFSLRKPPTLEELRSFLADFAPAPRPGAAEEWQLGILNQDKTDEEWLLGIPAVDKEAVNDESDPVDAKQVTCPACGAAMRRRRATRGVGAGRLFWSCSNFPACRKVLPIS